MQKMGELRIDDGVKSIQSHGIDFGRVQAAAWFNTGQRKGLRAGDAGKVYRYGGDSGQVIQSGPGNGASGLERTVYPSWNWRWLVSKGRRTERPEHRSHIG